MRKSMIGVLATMALLLGVMVLPATAENNPDVHWDGKNGLDSIIECEDGQEEYLHWVLTPGSQSDIDGATLYVDGVNATTFEKSGNGEGAWHAYTGLVGLEANIWAEVEGGIGNNARLVISDGCEKPDETPEPEVPIGNVALFYGCVEDYVSYEVAGDGDEDYPIKVTVNGDTTIDTTMGSDEMFFLRIGLKVGDVVVVNGTETVIEFIDCEPKDEPQQEPKDDLEEIKPSKPATPVVAEPDFTG